MTYKNLHNRLNIKSNQYNYKKKRIYRWYIFNITLSLILLTYISYYQIKQTYAYNKSYQKYKELELYINNQKQYVKQNKNISKSIKSIRKKINVFSSDFKEQEKSNNIDGKISNVEIGISKPLTIDKSIEIISQIIPRDTKLKSVKFVNSKSKHKINIEGLSKTYNSISDFIYRLLNQKEFKNIIVKDIKDMNKREYQELMYNIDIELN